MTQWTITKDHTATAGSKQGTNNNAVGLVGPRKATLTHEQIVNHPEGVRFRMKDDEDEVYYEGVLVGENQFAPLDDYGEPNAGCTYIEVFENDVWSIV